jgi:hypothetical protein
LGYVQTFEFVPVLRLVRDGLLLLALILKPMGGFALDGEVWGMSRAFEFVPVLRLVRDGLPLLALLLGALEVILGRAGDDVIERVGRSLCMATEQHVVAANQLMLVDMGSGFWVSQVPSRPKVQR